ncbi:E3 ubiquitin-protein ligase NEURL1-like isoform X1 [Xyrauchen texanus]|uniref:E3 ubiquitin-protein ligase NEURL1-like isoform X1 n=1 Tax=Xyrauchen texanus TaxID=154827 RepID=UPI002241D225|nr:E3 ubiquitin-protein ligase NEURL1-like isoform X1 [Xyrauchen texanus]
MGGQVSRNNLHEGGSFYCHPLKESMYPDPQAPLPLSFHSNTKGSQILMDKTQRCVRRIASFCNAITFTNRPVRIYEQVRLKITKRQGCWSGALRVGFTTVDPSDLSSSWLPRFACPDLVCERGFWARALPEEQCEEGTILSFWLDNTGQVFYQVNECSAIVFFSGVPAGEPVWAIIDIYGLTRGVQLLDSKMVPAEYFSPAVTNEVMDDWHLSSNCSQTDLQEDLPSFSSSPNSLNSVLSPQLHNDLHFHCVHGNGLRLLTEHIAVRYYNRHEDCTLVFTHRPLRCGECVFLKVLLNSQTVIPTLNSFLSYGFTSCNPAHINPKHLAVSPEDLLDRREFWAFGCLTSPLMGGDIIGFRASAEGEVLVSHNGGRAYREICVVNSTPLWMIFNLQTHIKQISILGTSCGYTSSSSEIHMTDISNCGYPPDNQIHRTIFRGFLNNFQTHPHSHSSSAGTTSNSLSSESHKTPSCCPIAGEECLICCERPVDSVLYACGHMSVCYICGGKLKEMSNPSCPMCRSPIRDIIKIYRSITWPPGIQNSLLNM